MSNTSANRRIELLVDLVELRRPAREVEAQLRSYPWDVDEPLVQVGVGDVVRALDAFESGRISAKELAEWADALELRDDVHIDKNLSSFFVETSAPEIFEPITPGFAARWRLILG